MALNSLGGISVRSTQSGSDARELVTCNDVTISQGKCLTFQYAAKPSKDFCSFIESNGKSETVDFFRAIITELEDRRNIWNFHLRVVDLDDNFQVQIYYGLDKKGPKPLPLEECISCYPEAKFYPKSECNLKAEECILHEFSDPMYNVCRFDAKARPGFIVTPVRHVERMSDLNDDELHSMWNVAVKALRHSECPFTRIILNHGSYRNLEHLHLKVWVDPELYQLYRTKWCKRRQEVWKELEFFVAEKKRRKMQAMK